MRHGKRKGKLNRRTSWRKATLKSMANDLFTFQRIETTLAKAKALQSFAEPLVTLAKNNSGSVAARRQAFGKLCDRGTVKALFDEIAPLYKDVQGGYTRIMMLGARKGDGAQMAMIELVKRTIPDDELLGITKEKKLEAKKKEKKKAKAAAGTKEEKVAEEHHVAPEVAKEIQEEKVIEERKREKAKTEQEKITKKGGFFRRFQRKKLGPKPPK